MYYILYILVKANFIINIIATDSPKVAYLSLPTEDVITWIALKIIHQNLFTRMHT